MVQKLVINNVSFQIKRGKITSFIGPNGAGKSTVLAMMSRLLKKILAKFLLMVKSYLNGTRKNYQKLWVF